MFVAFVLALLEPYLRMGWRFESNRIIYQIHWPLYYHTKVWDLPGLDRLELHRREAKNPRQLHLPEIKTDLANLRLFALAVVDGNNVDLCYNRNLTEGQARWMARVIQERRPQWFAK